MGKRAVRAGWRPDPAHQHRVRYWNGTTWTESVADDGPAFTDATYDPSGLTPPAPPRRPTWVYAAIGIGIVVVIAAALNNNDNEENATRSEPRDESTFYVDFSDCWNDTLDAETCALDYTPRDSYGTHVECVADTLPDSFCAKYFEVLAPTTVATLPPTVPPTGAPVPLAAPTPSGDCNPNYSGCVPNASDVDCEGGSGNGPAYTGEVEVIGVDVYDLDADGDGIACE